MWGTGAFVPRRVTKSTRDVQHIAFDYVVCANRLITQNPDVLVQSIAPVIRPSTVIVMTQNGVGVERPLRQAFMANPILSAICYVNCHQVSPGAVRQSSALGSLGFKIGNFDSDITIRDSGKLKVDALVTLDPKFGLIEDLEVERWTKAVINGSWNPVTAILGLETHELIATSDLGLALVQRLSEEIFHVAVACGVPLPSDLRSRVIASVRNTRSMATSMLRDARKKRQMEIETLCGTSGWDLFDSANVFQGNISRHAESIGAAAPTVKAVYQILALMNEIFRQRVSPSTDPDLIEIVHPPLHFILAFLALCDHHYLFKSIEGPPTQIFS